MNETDRTDNPTSVFATIEEAIAEFRAGRMLIMTDDEDRENEGDLILPASAVTPEAINFMTLHARGLICLPATAERLAELDLDLMVARGTALHGTNFTVSIDAVHGTTTGISAADRAATIRTFIDPATRPSDLARPGHVFPLRACEGGVLKRAGHTEGVVDLARLAGLYPAGVLCEILREDGSMARMPELIALAQQHGLKIVTIRDLIEYRMRTEKLVRRVVTTRLPNRYGVWDLHLYESLVDNESHVALVMGKVEDAEDVLVRVHSQCFTGDTLGSLRCDCNAQLHAAMQRIAEEGLGVLLYLHQEGRGIGLKAKLMAYALQDQGRDTVEANEDLGYLPDPRNYGIGAQILRDLGLHRIRIMTNNPRKLVGLSGYHLEITDRVPLVVGVHDQNIEYLRTKREKLGHLIGKEAVEEET
ncbi:MAG: bifunctional 3,4-dihydroxy-2-butanone-4-phosphate synthase/GTP cyclohydrolase II [Candidatus Sumerlaeia bacterium]|nr:bifunctional 3,4-dihydroxy-2-butanone-4-phosphate synthase/GTP cyclohydrolase II [Candidatus Sumerlaeia bacterium]